MNKRIEVAGICLMGAAPVALLAFVVWMAGVEGEAYRSARDSRGLIPGMQCEVGGIKTPVVTAYVIHRATDGNWYWMCRVDCGEWAKPRFVQEKFYTIELKPVGTVEK